MKYVLQFLTLSIVSYSASAQSQPNLTAEQQTALAGLDAKTTHYGTISRQIWNWAELGYQEVKSSALLQDELKKAGFTVQAGVAGIPTAFVATYGSGKPVIGLLAEFDALPGINQDAVPEHKPIEGKNAGHACGHHLFGTGSVASAIAVKNWLKQTGKTGTLRLYGCPAEEGGFAKVYMVREGLFADTDMVLHWHPSGQNNADPVTFLATISGKFRFRGISAHAASAPERGRSALDGVEAMNYMVNMMREHVPADTRMHYVITRGGEAPNVVPDFAEVYIAVRHPDRAVLLDIWKRIIKTAEGAALGTGTTMDFEVIYGSYNVLPVESLSRIMHKNLTLVGGVTYTPDEKAFAEKISESFGTSFGMLHKPGEAAAVMPFSTQDMLVKASTDVGDVSWMVPTAGLFAATWVPGTSAHSWQAVAAGGMSIGVKGMMVAAKTLTLTATDLFSDPTLVAKARADWQAARGQDFQYRALLGDRKPDLTPRR